MNYNEAFREANDDLHYAVTIINKEQGRIVYRVPKTIPMEVFALYNQGQRKKYLFWREYVNGAGR